MFYCSQIFLKEITTTNKKISSANIPEVNETKFPTDLCLDEAPEEVQTIIETLPMTGTLKGSFSHTEQLDKKTK